MANGPVSIWAAGTDTLLQTLAQREAAKQLELEKQRRAQLDIEDRADREAMREHQRRQLLSLDEDRDERRRLAEANALEKKTASQQEAAMKDLQQSAIWEYQNADTPERKKKAQETLSLQFGMKFETPKGRTGSWRKSAGPGGTEVEDWVWDPQEGEDPGARTVYHPPKTGPAGEKPDPRLKDNPLFPRGAQQWVDSVIAEGKPMQETMSRIAAGWPQQLAAHPNASLAEAVKHAKNFYTGATNRPIMNAPAGGGGAADPLRAEAIKALEAGGREVNEDTVAEVVKRLQARGAGGAGAPPPRAPGGPLSAVPQVAPVAGHAPTLPRPTGKTFLPPPPSPPLTPIAPMGSRGAVPPPPRVQPSGHRLAAGEALGAPPPPKWQPTPAQRERAIQLLNVNGLEVNDNTIALMVQEMLSKGIK